MACSILDHHSRVISQLSTICLLSCRMAPSHTEDMTWSPWMLVFEGYYHFNG